MSKARKKLYQLGPEQQLCVCWRTPRGGIALDFYTRDERERLDHDLKEMDPWEWDVDVIDRHAAILDKAYDRWLFEQKPQDRALDHWLWAKDFYF